MTLSTLVEGSSILVCCGTGGVGKTTTAATLALEAARRGRRAVVVTIDPAKRLADALGVPGGLSNDPVPIELPDETGRTSEPAEGGELWAMMLDTRTTFDTLVRRDAADEAQAERILANRFYRNIAGALSGTQEYMAAQKLHELHCDERFDLVVVDTPPTRNALDFLEAPARLMRFFDHKLFRLLMAPARGGLKVLNIAAQPVLRTIGRVVGTEVLNDAIAFFQAFEGMETGFRARADEVTALLRSPETAYVLVASPRHDTVEEAQFFADRLRELGLTVAALVVNRLHPTFDGGGPGSAARARHAAATATHEGREQLAALWRNLAELREVAEREEAELAPLVDHIGSAPVARAPLMADDVHDADGLAAIASHLFDRHGG
jgi:anion-transporting  ArsA/GET3 family ATPase